MLYLLFLSFPNNNTFSLLSLSYNTKFLIEALLTFPLKFKKYFPCFESHSGFLDSKWWILFLFSIILYNLLSPISDPDTIPLRELYITPSLSMKTFIFLGPNPIYKQTVAINSLFLELKNPENFDFSTSLYPLSKIL